MPLLTRKYVKSYFVKLFINFFFENSLTSCFFSFQPRYSDPLQANSEICKFVRIKEIFSHKDRWLLRHIILRQSYVGVKKNSWFFSVAVLYSCAHLPQKQLILYKAKGQYFKSGTLPNLASHAKTCQGTQYPSSYFVGTFLDYLARTFA